jgi:hypothetical protein
MSLPCPPRLRRSLAIATTALVTGAALGLSAAPVTASPSAAVQAAPTTLRSTTGYSLCYTYYADYAIGQQVRTSHQKAFSATWDGARSHLTGKSFHYHGLLKTWGYFYEWVYGTNGSKNCTTTADILEWKVSFANRSISHTGRTSRPGVAVRLIGPDGVTLCSATSATTPVSAGGFPFECSVRFDRAPGTYTVTGEASRQWLRPVSATTTVVVPATPVASGIRIVSSTASPNPTTGPVTVSGTTNRPGVAIQVTRPDGSVLCTTAGSSTNVGGRFDFSCSGTVSGNPGSQRLTIRATGPNGGRTTSTVDVTLRTAPTTTTLKIGSIAANPNPSTGPVTITGTTNRPGVKVQVKNQDGSVLCECNGATTSTNGSFAFSCSGVVSGKPGDKTLAVRVTGPNGNTVRTTVAVHKSAS